MRFNWSDTARIEVIYCEPLKCVTALGDFFVFALPMLTSRQTNIGETKLGHPSKQSGHVEWKRQHTARRSVAVSCFAAGGAPLDSILILPPKPPLHSLCAGDATLVSIWSCTQGRVEKNTANDILHVYCVLWRKTEQRRVYMRGVWNIVSRPHGTWLPSVHWLSSARKSLEMAQTPPAKQNPWKFFKSSLSETGKICKLGFLRFFLYPLLTVGAQNEKWKQKCSLDTIVLSEYRLLAINLLKSQVQ